jgi:peptidoglycan hydrolase CwlO-like protein
MFLCGFFVVAGTLSPAGYVFSEETISREENNSVTGNALPPREGKGGGNGSETKKIELEEQIKNLEEEAEAIDKTIQEVQGQTRTFANEKKTIDAEIRRREIEILRLNLAIQKADIDIKNKTAAIDFLTKKIDVSRKSLTASLFLLYAYDRDNAVTLLLKNESLSDFFDAFHNLGKVQENVKDILDESKEDKGTIEKEKEEREEFKEDQHGLKMLQEVERKLLAQKRKEKEELIRLTKGKEALFQQLLKSKKRDIAALKTQLFYLERTGISAEEAVRLADLAAKRAGIRTAFLLALLEVETGKQFENGEITVGTNVGTGNWERDMYQCYVRLGRRGTAEAEKKAYFEIMGKLNLNPDKMPVSRRPNYGCGGAMGPAQFLPTTWLRFESRVTELTGHNPPNPWNTEDAFTAAAIFLSEAGASSQTTAGETQAARTYISGSPKCSRYICRSYANRIIALARDIDRIL